jgi:hypothetical protein
MSLLCAIALLAAPSTPPPATTVEVRTHRSDGAVFPAVVKTGRVQRPRAARVFGSRQAGRPPGRWRESVEPPQGGHAVAPAGAAESAGPPVAVVLRPPR